MKKQVTVEKTYCDLCGSEDSWSHCLGCGKDACYHCYSETLPATERKAVRYSSGVYTGGSDDAVYCTPCDIRLSETKSSPLHRAFTAVRDLRDEARAWNVAFDKRRRDAEARVRELR
jgi:hypothetical protein